MIAVSPSSYISNIKEMPSCKVLSLSRGGVSGQSSNSNSTNRYFMTAPILAQIYAEMKMKKEDGLSETGRRNHHQLTKAYIDRQNKWIVSLLSIFKRHNVTFLNHSPLFNIITGQVFSAEIYNDLIGAYKKGQELYKTFVEERLKPGSQVGILAPITKLKINTCKQGNKGGGQSNIKIRIISSYPELS